MGSHHQSHLRYSTTLTSLSGSFSQHKSRAIILLFCSKSSNGESHPYASMTNILTAYEALHDSASHSLWPHPLLLFSSGLNSATLLLHMPNKFRTFVFSQNSLVQNWQVRFPFNLRSLLKHTLPVGPFLTFYTEYHPITSPFSLVSLYFSSKHFSPFGIVNT